MSERTRENGTERRPLVIANGFMPWPIPLEHIARAYQEFGYEPHVIPYRLADMLDANTYARSINLVLHELYLLTGRRADVVGISMGGVCSLYAIKHLDAARCVRTLVCAGSPLHGSPLAFVATCSIFHRTGRQLTRGSSFLQRLHDGPLPEEVRYVTVGGLLDLICPAPVTVLEGGEPHFLPFRHYHLMASPSLHREIARIIVSRT